MKYLLPQLPYSYDALEPWIDTVTMQIHHTKHHQTYTNNLNLILEKYPSIIDERLDQLLKDLQNLKMDEKDKMFFKNNAGGYINHNLYWKIMGPKKEIDEKLRDELKKEFGSIEEFKKIFSDISLKHFGSGWTWLVKNEKGNLETYSMPNQDSPFFRAHQPIIALDVWEHAYYLKYQNRRAEYIDAWWNALKIL